MPELLEPEECETLPLAYAREVLVNRKINTIRIEKIHLFKI
jgi:hypothetical protein